MSLSMNIKVKYEIRPDNFIEKMGIGWKLDRNINKKKESIICFLT